jgi:hypothetical protein
MIQDSDLALAVESFSQGLGFLDLDPGIAASNANLFRKYERRRQ